MMTQHFRRRLAPYVLLTGKKHNYHWLWCEHSNFPSAFTKSCPELQGHWWNPELEPDSASYLFENEPNFEQENLIRAIPADADYPDLENSNEQFWQILEQAGVKAYKNDHLIVLKDEALVKHFLASAWVRDLPDEHIKEYKFTLQTWLAMERTAEPCAQPGCQHQRIKYGANCARHHFEMLTKEPFSDADLLG